MPGPTPAHAAPPDSGAAPPLPVVLSQLVPLIDEGLRDSLGPVLIKLTSITPAIELGIRPLPAWEPPLDVLLGFTAPPSWLALGLHCLGHAHKGVPDSQPLPERPYAFNRSAAGDRTSVTFTVLLGRDGHGAGIMREGDDAISLPFPPEGVLGDACRRALALPTSPPPPTTVELWLRVWLDRLVDAVAFLGADRYRDWSAVCSLHPVAAISGGSHFESPVALAEATCRLAEAWPWDRLRQEPDIVEVPQPRLSREVSDWMDDGMYARWTLSSLPTTEDLGAALLHSLSSDGARRIGETVSAAGMLWLDL